jgi:glutamate--cysteine ligase
MYSLENINSLLPYDEFVEHLSQGKIGIEKESLRISGSSISTKDHSSSLGSPLCNKYITTDFSESQIELITPPFEKNRDAFDFLEDIHHFVNLNVDEDSIWPFSIPPYINSEDNIKIASYGSSNHALFKETYRRGLAHRYGKLMQIISGVHFNYSLPDKIWKILQKGYPDIQSINLKSIIYFRMLRNIKRMNWLILYLFGASPILNEQFVRGQKDDFRQYKGFFYAPYATSLRMSDIGYQNFNQPNFFVPLDSIDNYINAIKDATNKQYIDYEYISSNLGSLAQLNSNFLQIEDEYYSVIRPKSNEKSDLRTLKKLSNTGVEYIEFRSLDLDPFSPTGITLETLNFVEIFLLYSAFLPSPNIDNDESLEIENNDLKVARYGRKPLQVLTKNGKSISLQDWAHTILEGMDSLSLDLGNNEKYLSSYKEIIKNNQGTLSELFLEKVLSSQLDYQEIGIALSEQNQKSFIERNTEKNKNYKILENEVDRSLLQQKNLELDDTKSFDTFLNDYFC